MNAYNVAECVLISAVPRGGLQIIQPARFPEALVRRYVKIAEHHDRLTWQAIIGGDPVTDSQAWRENQRASTAFNVEFLGPGGFAHAAAVPLADPLFEGYPGALQFYRTGAQAPFSELELADLVEFSQAYSDALRRARTARHGNQEPGRSVTGNPPSFIALDRNLRSLLPQADLSRLDPVLLQNLLDDARAGFARVNGSVINDRVALADSRGELSHFRVIFHSTYPALDDAAVAFYCLQPDWDAWGTLRPADFQADDEVARLIPAVRFMRDHFQRGPTLVEIARTVHLSPYHFHRRFSELLGITPKHLLLDCQIHQAKRDLMDPRKDLASIASGCGFAHQSHFTSRFKQATGLTPTRWRKTVKPARSAD